MDEMKAWDVNEMRMMYRPCFLKWMAKMSMGMLFEDESDRKSFRSECLLIRLWMLRLASKGLDEFEKLLQSAGMS